MSFIAEGRPTKNPLKYSKDPARLSRSKAAEEPVAAATPVGLAGSAGMPAAVASACLMERTPVLGGREKIQGLFAGPHLIP